MKTIIIDFDHTLFNATKYKKAMSESLKKFGVSEKMWQETYQQAKLKNGIEREIRPNYQLEILAKKYSLDIKKLSLTYKKTIRNTKKFIYPDSLPFLKNCQKLGYKLVLLTFGDPTFQKEKIISSGIDKYFNKIVATNKDKHQISYKIANSPETIFINDNPHEIENLMKIYPMAKFIKITRADGKKYNLKTQFTYVNNLKNISVNPLINNNKNGLITRDGIYCLGCLSEKLKKFTANNKEYYFCNSCKKKSGRALVIDHKIKTEYTPKGLKHFTVGALIKRNNKYLIMKKKTFPYLFDVIAGHIDTGEKPEISLKREIKEETGLQIIKYQLLFEGLLKNDKCRRGVKLHYWYLFLCQATGINRQNPEAQFSQWMSKNMMKINKFCPGITKIFKLIKFFTSGI